MRDRLNHVLAAQLLERPENTMHAVTYNTARANLIKMMDRVCDDNEPVIITRLGKQAVVMMSLDDFNS
ncbi:MAG: type II toxin-antitoxin system Phd/YefM family antitoxin, partial [Dokdonella sp.]